MLYVYAAVTVKVIIARREELGISDHFYRLRLIVWKT